LADVRTRKILGKVASTAKDRQIDDFQYLESSGTWAPDSRRFAFVAYQDGRSVILIKDVFSRKTLRSIIPKNLFAIANPAWSPDGNFLVFTGLHAGQTDLYLYDLNTDKLSNLTEDRYSEIQPNWSWDGKRIIFSTDQLSQERGPTKGKWTFNLAEFNFETYETELFDFLHGANNLNAGYTDEGQIVFLSDRDGYRNIHRFNPDSGTLFRLTDLLTGVSGITMFAPAISVGGLGKKVVYTHYFQQKYRLYHIDRSAFASQMVASNDVDHSAAILPVDDPSTQDIVSENFQEFESMPNIPDSLILEKPYRAKFRLDYVAGGTSVGVGTGSYYGTGSYMSGGVDLLFGDMLGYHQLYTGIYLNGEIYDFGAIVAYLNQKKRFPWGVSLSHIPYTSGRSYYPVIDTFRAEFLAC
jgi:hypothetical protein